MEVLVWSQSVANANPTNPSGPDALRRLLYPLELYQPASNQPYANLRVPLIETASEEPSVACGVEDVRFIEFREVFSNEEGDRTYAAGPTFTIAVTNDEAMQLAYVGLGGCNTIFPDACSTGSGSCRSFVRPRRTNPPPGAAPTVPAPLIRDVDGLIPIPD
jgi:hypothetical protein